jgi:hypothetical protein
MGPYDKNGPAEKACTIKKQIQMKLIINNFLILFVSLCFTFSTTVLAGSEKVKTAEFKVEGICGMCKERIENGALIKGVKKAEWDKETSMITVIYNPKKVTLMEIHKAVAEVGHSTDKVKAEQSVYDKLPACCKYNDGVNKH